MNNRKYFIWAIIFLMTVGVILLSFLQVRYIRNTSKLLDEQLFANIQNTLYRVIRNAEAAELQYHVDSLMQAQAVDLSIPTDDDYIVVGSNEISLNKQGSSLAEVMREHQIRHQQLLEYRQRQLNEIATKMMFESGEIDILKRINLQQIDDELTEQLHEKHIITPYYLTITECRTGRIIQEQHHNDSTAKEKSNYTTTITQRLFPKQVGGTTYYINMYVPKNSASLGVFSRFYPQLILLVFIYAIFILLVLIIMQQQKMAKIKSDFVNNMTHELKTPTASISLAAQMLNDDSLEKDPEMVTNIANIINDESERLKQLIDKVLQTSVLDTEKSILRIKECDVHTLIEKAKKSLMLKVQNEGGDIQLRLDAKESWAMVDETHFANVIYNLMENAIKYRQDKPPVLNVSTSNKGDYIVIAVTDNGIGIKKENLKHIFEKFYRVPTGNVHDVKGFGLGLAYVKKIVDAHHATIEVDSEPMIGSTFTIKIKYLQA